MCIYIISQYNRSPETKFRASKQMLANAYFHKSVSWVFRVVLDTANPFMHPHSDLWVDHYIFIGLCFCQSGVSNGEPEAFERLEIFCTQYLFLGIIDRRASSMTLRRWKRWFMSAYFCTKNMDPIHASCCFSVFFTYIFRIVYLHFVMSLGCIEQCL
jgi:hypothetical protein